MLSIRIEFTVTDKTCFFIRVSNVKKKIKKKLKYFYVGKYVK
jgi:hypothetical protein